MLEKISLKPIENTEASPFQQRIQKSRHVIKSLKLETDQKRTTTEKLADSMTAFFGSTLFLILNTLWFVVWLIINLNMIPGIHAFDPFPFSLLTMIVSLEAIILSVFVLISQNRASKVDDLRDEIDFQVDLIAEDKITKMLEILIHIARKNGIDLEKDKVLEEMLNPLDRDKIEKTIEKQM